MMNEEPNGLPEEYHGWPGDGSGEDDLADYNQAEADDYRNEGLDDQEECDSMNEGLEEPTESDDTPMGQEYGDGFDW